MYYTSRKVRFTLVLIAAWSIVQTLFHLFWVIYGYLMTICRIKPTYYDVAFVYLTYFYRESCGVVDIKNATLFLDRAVHNEDIDYINQTTSNLVYHFINATLQKAHLPPQSALLPRTEMYLTLLFITDVLWIGTSVCLTVGAFYKVKQKYLLAVFYGPWLLCSIFVNFLDVVSSVQYGIDLISIRSYTNWLEFIGVTNYEDFKLYDKHPSSSIIPTLPTTVMVSLLCRLFIVWLVNVISFFIILFLAIPDLFWRTTVRPKTIGQGKLTLSTSTDLELNSSEARIRAWQQFYGAIEANSTMTSTSGVASNISDNNGNNLKTRDNKGNIALNPNNIEMTDENSGFKRYSDVACGFSDMDPNMRKLIVLRDHHMSWSYIRPEEDHLSVKMSQTNEEIDEVGDIYCTILTHISLHGAPYIFYKFNQFNDCLLKICFNK